MNDLLRDYGHQVLVVEDCDEDFDTVMEAARLGGVRHQLVRAASVDEARACLAAAEPGAFAFMLLDCSLPGEDGLALLQEARRDARHASLPVVVLTTSISPRDRNAFYAAGANAYHGKSVRYDESLDTLQHLFSYWLRQVILPVPRNLAAMDVPL